MSKRYIDADKLFEALNRTHQKAMAGFDWVRVNEVFQSIADIQTADVVERKRGKWVNAKPRSGKVGLICSACENEAYWDSDYGQQEFNWCPYCGAMMERSEDGETD